MTTTATAPPTGWQAVRPSARFGVPTRRAALRVDGVRVRFGGLTAVDVEELVVWEGRVVGLIGANGAGKTTLMDCVSGMVIPEAGTITMLDEIDLTGLSPSQRARYGLGRSFQNAVLFESLTVAETLAVALERKVSGEDIVSGALRLPWARRLERKVAAEVEELVDLLGLGAFHDKFISELSTGSRRIVDLACIIAHRPRLLLLDEPSSGIAQREVEALQSLLLRVKETLGCTLVVIEHDIPMIRELADELYAMEVGRVIAHGTPDEVLGDPEVIRSYLGTDTRAVERSGTTSTQGDALVPLPAAADAFAGLTVAELREAARRGGIPGRSKMRRDELVAALVAGGREG